jgi:hypothetical protein
VNAQQQFLTAISSEMDSVRAETRELVAAIEKQTAATLSLDSDAAWATIETLADARVAKDAGLSHAQAVTEVLATCEGKRLWAECNSADERRRAVVQKAEHAASERQTLEWHHDQIARTVDGALRSGLSVEDALDHARKQHPASWHTTEPKGGGHRSGTSRRTVTRSKPVTLSKEQTAFLDALREPPGPARVEKSAQPEPAPLVADSWAEAVEKLAGRAILSLEVVE